MDDDGRQPQTLAEVLAEILAELEGRREVADV
jgi:hypothetical protein